MALAGPGDTLSQRLVLARAQDAILRQELRDLRSLPQLSRAGGSRVFPRLLTAMAATIPAPIVVARDRLGSNSAGTFIRGSVQSKLLRARDAANSLAWSLGMTECAPLHPPQPPGIVRFQQANAQRDQQSRLADQRALDRRIEAQRRALMRGNAVCRQANADIAALPPVAATTTGAINYVKQIAPIVRRELRLLQHLPLPRGGSATLLLAEIKTQLALGAKYVAAIRRHDIRRLRRLDLAAGYSAGFIKKRADLAGLPDCDHFARAPMVAPA